MHNKLSQSHSFIACQMQNAKGQLNEIGSTPLIETVPNISAVPHSTNSTDSTNSTTQYQTVPNSTKQYQTVLIVPNSTTQYYTVLTVPNSIKHSCRAQLPRKCVNEIKQGQKLLFLLSTNEWKGKTITY